MRYVERNQSDWSRIQDAEVEVSLVKPDYILLGKVDLIRGEGDTVEIVDFKSEKKPDVLIETAEMNRYRRQLEVYAHLIEEKTGTENDESGLVAAEKIKKTMPQIKVIIVTSLVECSFIDRARKAGVESFWYKDAGKEELLEVMDRTMKGENVYPDAPPVVMIGTAKSCDFTPGELAVLRLVVEGESYKKIAESLCISPETVKWHIKNMLQKTNFDSKTKLAVAVTKKNLIINGF